MFKRIATGTALAAVLSLAYGAGAEQKTDAPTGLGQDQTQSQTPPQRDGTGLGQGDFKVPERDTKGPGAFGDVDRNGIIDFRDLILVLSQWGECKDCSADLTGDGFVDWNDLLRLLSVYPSSTPVEETGTEPPARKGGGTSGGGSG